MKLILLTAFALLAFAANSLLARFALLSGEMGAIEFTLVRLGFGVVVLWSCIRLKDGQRLSVQFEDGSWLGAIALLAYAICFSFAYLALDTGTGALVLFAAVQFTIIAQGVLRRSISPLELVGASIAFAGFVYLIFPSIGSPSVIGFLAMSVSGIGWGVYTILGRSCEFPLLRTSGNFMRATLVASGSILFVLPTPTWSSAGIIAAMISGGVTSALGYAVWYSVVPKLTSALSASIQLLVPIFAALLGWLFLSEELTGRLTISGAVILIGLATTIRGRTTQNSS